MKLKNILYLLLVFFFTQPSFGQLINPKFKKLHTKALTHLDNENYADALSILLEMGELDDRNYKTMANIGYCFLVSDFEKSKSIPYFEKILEDYKNMSLKYSRESHKERSAPVEVLHWIGKAYHFNYEFEKALVKYKEYKDVLKSNSTESLAEVNRDIAITENAILLRNKPVEIQIKGIANINTEHPEYRPKITGDENIMYFTSRRPNDSRSAQDSDGEYYEDIYYSVRKHGEWSKPSLMDDNINSAAHEACLYISPDGQYMLIFKASSATQTEGGIYETSLNGETWSTPTLLAANVNSNYWETDVNISADRKTIYFTSDRPNGEGGRDIWIMKKLPNGEWADVQNIGNVINTRYDEEAPYLHPDGKTLYFSSKGHNTMGGYDVFRSELGADGSWSTPQNIGFPINTTGDDVFYFPTNDGQRAYFSSYRGGGKGDQDIYIMQLPNNEEKTLAVYKGDALYEDGSVIKDMVITIFDDETGEEIGIYRPNSSTGRFLFILQPGQYYEIEFDSDGAIAKENVDVPTEGGLQEITRLIIKEGDSLFIKAATVNDEDIITLIEDENPDNVVVKNINIGTFKKPVDNADVVEETSKTDPPVTDPIDVVEETPKTDPPVTDPVDVVEETPKTDPPVTDPVDVVEEAPKTDPPVTDPVDVVEETPKTDPPVTDPVDVVMETPKTDPLVTDLVDVVAETPKTDPPVTDPVDVVVETPKTDPLVTDLVDVVAETPKTDPPVTDPLDVVVETPKTDPPVTDPMDVIAETPKTESTVNSTENVIKYPNQSSLLKDLYFKYDKVILIDESEIDYDKALSYLETHTDTKVMIEGHTDSHGSSKYNYWLSSARSNKIRNRMYDNGISWGRMETRGYGEDKPIAPNKNPDGSDNPEGRLLNRRVSFILDEPEVSEMEKDTSAYFADERPTPNYTTEYDEATVSFSEEVVCMIQLGAFTKALDNKKFTDEPLEVAYYKDEDGLYKYLSGVFINKEVALEHRLRMISTGYEGAFIVYFKDGKRLNTEEIALLYPSEEGIELIETTVKNK